MRKRPAPNPLKGTVHVWKCGHAPTPDNVVVADNGTRQRCRTCALDRSSRGYYAAKARRASGVAPPSVELTVERLNEIVEVVDGVPTWRDRPGTRGFNKAYVGKPLDTRIDSRGYLRAHIEGKDRLLHRVLWALAYGEWPKQSIDHIDGDQLNNDLANLRDVSCSDNSRNMKLFKNNTSGHVGVKQAHSGGWTAFIGVDRRTVYLGTFDDKGDAIAARLRAQALHGFSQRHGAPSDPDELRAA